MQLYLSFESFNSSVRCLSRTSGSCCYLCIAIIKGSIGKWCHTRSFIELIYIHRGNMASASSSFSSLNNSSMGGMNMGGMGGGGSNMTPHQVQQAAQSLSNSEY